MSGNIQVVDNTQASPSSAGLSSNTQESADTVGILMVPPQDSQTYTTDLETVHIISRTLEDVRVKQVTNSNYLRV
jgi:hypothetical protein